MKLDHLGIAVKSLDSGIRFYHDLLGLDVGHVEEVAAEKVRVAMLPLGDTRVELLEATSDDSAIARFVAKRGEGLHHIAMKVDDLNTAVERLKAAGARLVNDQPGVGAGGHRYVFVHPQSTGGVLLELVEDGNHGTKWEPM
jgi:methylmalonyl-CoA epimerase